MDPHMTQLLYRDFTDDQISIHLSLKPATSGLLVKPACPSTPGLPRILSYSVLPPPSCSSYGDSHPMNHHSSDLAVRSWSNLSGLSRFNTNRHCHQVTVYGEKHPPVYPQCKLIIDDPHYISIITIITSPLQKKRNRPMPAPCTCSRTPRWHLRPGSPWVRCHRPRFLGSWSTGHGSRCHCHNLAGVEGPGK